MSRAARRRIARRRGWRSSNLLCVWKSPRTSRGLRHTASLWTSQLRAVFGLTALCWLAVNATDVFAMAPGRTWAPIDTLRLSHAYIVPDRFEPIRHGRIELLGNGYYGAGGRREYGFEWADSAWSVRWSLGAESYWVRPTLTPIDHQMLVWKTTTPLDSAFHQFSQLVTADVFGDSVTAPDTVARVDAASLVYMGAAWGRRRWVVTQDGQGLPLPIRIYRSDSAFQWTQMRVADLSGRHGVVMAPLDSGSVLVVTSESDERLRWGVLRDTTWTAEPVPLAEYGPHNPSIIRQSASRLRVAWSSYDDFLRSRVYENGAWGEPDTIRAILPDSIQHLFYQAELSREESDHPALAWYGYKIHGDVAWYVWVAFPSDTGFGLGEKLPGSWGGINPTCLVDENEDVWVAWWREYDGMYWTHSYCAAAASPPTIDTEGGRPRLRWSLSASAPSSWWAVMRGIDGGPPEPVARVRAGPAVTMTWTDSTAPARGTLRYSIRRECRDVRYQVASAEAEWRPSGPSIGLTISSENPAGTSVRFELSGASAGKVEVLLYDPLGRLLASRTESASGSGVDRFELPLTGRIRPGLYLLRARGADGRLTRSAKVVVIR